MAWGPRRGRRVTICVHGYSGNSRDFDFLAGALARDAHVVCPDMAGRGRSEWLHPFEYHFGQFLADIRTMLARLGVQEVDWVGTSMGGLLGLMLAAQPSNPIRRLVLNDVGAFVPLDALQHIARNLDAPQPFATRAEAEAHLRHTHRDWGPLSAAQHAHLARHGLRKAADGYRLHYDPAIAQVVQPMPLARGLYFWHHWYRVRCPVLLVRGEHSQVFPAEVAEAMLAVKPEAMLAEIPGCGHAPSLMTPQQARLVREFLASEPRSMAAISQGARHAQERLDPPRAA